MLSAVAGTMQTHHHGHVRVLGRAARQTKKVPTGLHTRASARTHSASQVKEHGQQTAVHSPERVLHQRSEYRQAGHCSQGAPPR